MYYVCTYVCVCMHGVCLREEVSTEQEGEKQFVLLKERAADIAVEIVGEVFSKVA